MSTQSEALKQYFYQHGISNVSVAESLGLGRATISNMLNGRDSIGHKRAQKLHDVYGFDRIFLLTGDGSLFPPAGYRRIEAGDNSHVTAGDNSPINISADAAALQAEVEHLRKENDRLWKMVEALTSKQ